MFPCLYITNFCLFHTMNGNIGDTQGNTVYVAQGIDNKPSGIHGRLKSMWN